MKVTLHYWAQVKQAAGIACEELELNAPCSAQELGEQAAERHGDPLRSFLLGEDNTPRRNLLLIVDDVHVRWNEPFPLQGGEEVTVLPPISGGLGR